MATPKTFEAADIKMGTLSIYVEGGQLHHSSPYKFIDAQGQVIDRLSGGHLSGTVDWTSVPQNIKDALLAIDTWRYGLALAKEGME